METWDELDNEDNSDKDEGEENLAVMAFISSNIEYESTSASEMMNNTRYILIYLVPI